MNLPTAAHVIVDRTNEPIHAPGLLVLLVEAPGLEVSSTRDSHPLSSGYTVHGSVVRGQKHSYTFAYVRVPTAASVRALTVSLLRNGPR